MVLHNWQRKIPNWTKVFVLGSKKHKRPFITENVEPKVDIIFVPVFTVINYTANMLGFPQYN